MYKYNRWPELQFNHGFRCFTRHCRPQDEQMFHSYGSCDFWPCMRTGWVLETSPSNHYWRRYEVGQWLVFGWFWGWGTLDTWLARQKLAKKTHPNHDGCCCPMAAMVPSPRHCCIQQLANMLRNKSVIKIREYYCFYYVFISYFKAQRIIGAPCLSVCGLHQQAALRVSYSQRAVLSKSIILSAGGAESMMLSACAESMIVSAGPADSMIISVPFDHVITLTC